MEIRQSESYSGDDWWQWSVWLDGTTEELDAVEYVDWHLHPTFPQPVRRVTDRSSKFRLETGGWGAFRVSAVATLKSGESVRLRHALELHYPDDTPTEA
jgi:transcription initiation factor IIF auxiliary subunit